MIPPAIANYLREILQKAQKWEWRFYYQNDSLWQRLNYTNGDMDGAIVIYDSLTRNIILEGGFAHNLKHGKWKTYYRDGKLKES